MEDIEGLYQFIKKLQSTNSRKEKEVILESATPFQKDVLEFLFNSYKPTGISQKKINAFNKPIQPKEEESLLSLLKYLQTHNTGSMADLEYVFSVAYASTRPELVLSIVKKDLRLGVNATTLNKIFGKGFIPVFEVQLAHKYFDDPEGLLPQGTPFIITEKLDGVRCVLIFNEDGSPHFYARSGKEIFDLIELEEEARNLDPSKVYDGELLVSGFNKSNDLYRQTMSVVGSDRVKTGVVFNVFDCLPKECFKEGFCPYPAYIRKEQVGKELKGLKHIREVPVLYSGTDKEKISELLEWAMKEGKEGIMINLYDSPYRCGRTPGLLKVKRFNECEAFVRSIETGTGRNSGRLGAIIVDIKDKKGRLHTVRVGSGFKDAERDYLYANPEVILEQVVEVGYFEVTKNKGDDSLSLRFPTWLNRIRPDKDLESMTSV